jgi:hypothetical protein
VLRFGRFAKTTGQTWKYRLWQVATVAAIAVSLAFFSLWNGNPAGLPEGMTIALYFLICVFWIIWWAAAIRCPSCGSRIGWYQMRHGSANEAPTRFLGVSVCPACGFDPPGDA